MQIHLSKKKAVISWCVLPSAMTKCSFSIGVNVMPDSSQPYVVIIGRDLMCQLQLKPDIVENMFQWNDIIIPMVPPGYCNKNRIMAFCSQKVVKLNRGMKD